MKTTPLFDGREDCPYCHGSGTVYDWVPYGMGNVQMPTDCNCVVFQLEEWEAGQETNDAEFDSLESQDDDHDR